MIDRKSNQVVHGKKGRESVEQIWIMEYDGTAWKLDDIQQGDLSLAYAKLKNLIPASVEERIKAF
ncbi:MAG: hypothetical protein MK078_01685 [Crocinitomicaceae bacterium]|nr:hypothetical protein [Crocinitomicaceae bacterium]